MARVDRPCRLSLFVQHANPSRCPSQGEATPLFASKQLQTESKRSLEQARTMSDVFGSASEDGDDGFVNYVEDTIDPGPSLLIATTILCVLMYAVLPCLVSFGKRYSSRRGKATVDATPSSDTNGKPVRFFLAYLNAAKSARLTRSHSPRARHRVLLLLGVKACRLRLSNRFWTVDVDGHGPLEWKSACT